MAAAASLGTYIQIHRTTQASVHFKNSVSAICGRLINCRAILLEEPETKESSDQLFADAKLNLNAYYENLTRQRNKQRAEGTMANYPEFREQMKEAQAVMDQLSWMYDISEHLFTALKTYKNG